MKLKPSTIARRTLGLSAQEFPKLVAQRVGTHADMESSWRAFEPVATTLVSSFYCSLDLGEPDRVSESLDRLPEELRGIGYEGAGMGLMLRDRVLPWRPQLQKFIYGPGLPYRSLICIGAGLVLARLPGDPMRFINSQDPLTRWFVADGYGFYDGFFRWESSVIAQQRPRRIHGYAQRAYDQGVGRSLWFSSGGQVERIRETLGTFPPSRQADLWGGIGLACAYAAGVLDQQAIEQLADAAGPYQSDVAVGVAVAAVFRAQSGLSAAAHTDLACQVLWREPAELVAAEADTAIAAIASGSVPPDGDTYRRWREALAARWDQSHRAAPAYEEVP